MLARGGKVIESSDYHNTIRNVCIDQSGIKEILLVQDELSEAL